MRSLVTLAVVLAPAIALAHPGHGTTEPSTWAHYLTEPLHIGVILAVATGVIELVLWRRPERRMTSTQHRVIDTLVVAVAAGPSTDLPP